VGIVSTADPWFEVMALQASVLIFSLLTVRSLVVFLSILLPNIDTGKTSETLFSRLAESEGSECLAI